MPSYLHPIFMSITSMLTLLFVSLLSISPATSANSPATIKTWCKKTPFPDTCINMVSENPKYHITIKSKYDFFNLSTSLALDHSISARRTLHSLASKFQSHHEEAAWSDCVELYANAIRHIGMTLDPNSNPTGSDAQTWLSTTLTNLEICKHGFIDFGITDSVVHTLANNLSQLISNALAMNQHGERSRSKKEEFPISVSPGERRLLSSSNPIPDIVVAKDGSGDYFTISEAIAAAAGRTSANARFVISVKKGTYKEIVNIGWGLNNIFMYGDGIGKTIITGANSVAGGYTTYSSATFAVDGSGFIAKGITFRNTAGPGQAAVAVRSSSDRSIFYKCSIEGYQDTLYASSNRQFFRECNIYGTVDFLFGNAAVVFQNCKIYALNPPAKTNVITAQGRTDPNQNTGISIQNCVIAANSTLPKSVRTYLGRPWKDYSRTVVIDSNLGSLINPAGWLAWERNPVPDTIYYGEYWNIGSASSTAKRVTWVGYHVITEPSVASQFTPGKFISGDEWIPDTNVPYTSGL